jgi:hypothetical protein
MAAPLTKEQKTTATIAKARVTNMTDFFFHRYRQAPADWARGNPYNNVPSACLKPCFQLETACRKRHGRLGKPGQFPIIGNSIRHFVVWIHGRTQ